VLLLQGSGNFHAKLSIAKCGKQKEKAAILCGKGAKFSIAN
jgi:hypothetical protein